MATISGITICSGGDHISGTVTLESGETRPFRATMSELRAAREEVDIREFILRQIVSLRQQFPNYTPTQFRNLVQSTEFME